VTLAARFSVPTIIFGAIFIPSANRIVDEGPVPGRPNMSYRWARDEAQVSFKVLIDGQWRPPTYGLRGEDAAAFYSPDGEVVARVVEGPRRRLTLVTSIDVLDRARMRHADDEPAAEPALDPIDGPYRPRLCPAPTPESKTTKSKTRSSISNMSASCRTVWR